MAGVNLNEENARILATSSELVGTKIRSCKDESFLPTGLLLRRILDTGRSVFSGVTLSPSHRDQTQTVRGGLRVSGTLQCAQIVEMKRFECLKLHRALCLTFSLMTLSEFRSVSL